MSISAHRGLDAERNVTFTSPSEAVVRDMLRLGRAGWPTHDPVFWIMAANRYTQEIEAAGMTPDEFKAMLEATDPRT